MSPLQLQHHQLDLDSPAPGTPVHSRYYKSCKQDKISDYEDIWAVSPTPAPAISPTASELRFKQFIFSQFTAQPEEVEAPCPSEPSYPSWSSPSPPGTSEEGEHDSLSLASFASSSQPDCIHTSDLSDPLAALEVLSDCDTDHDLDDDDDDIIYSDIESTDVAWDNIAQSDGNDVKDSPAGVDAGEASEGGSGAEERRSKPSGSGSLSGLLRKLSIRSRASLTKEKPPSCDKRLSAVIGCYLPPSLLGLSSEDCHVL